MRVREHSGAQPQAHQIVPREAVGVGGADARVVLPTSSSVDGSVQAPDSVGGRYTKRVGDACV